MQTAAKGNVCFHLAESDEVEPRSYYRYLQSKGQLEPLYGHSRPVMGWQYTKRVTEPIISADNFHLCIFDVGVSK